MRAMYAAQALALTSSYPQLKLAFQFQPSRNVVSSSSMVQVASEATSNVAEKDERRPSTASEAGGIGGPTTKKRRHSVLMDTSVKNFQRLLNNAGEHMRTEVENLPLRFYEWDAPTYVDCSAGDGVKYIVLF